MGFILRSLGIWLVALAMILAIVDGTRSLGANALVTTSLGDSWLALNAQSLASLQGYLDAHVLGAILNPALALILRLPGFVATGVPGLALLVFGRRRGPRRFVRQDQF